MMDSDALQERLKFETRAQHDKQNRERDTRRASIITKLAGKKYSTLENINNYETFITNFINARHSVNPSEYMTQYVQGLINTSDKESVFVLPRDGIVIDHDGFATAVFKNTEIKLQPAYELHLGELLYTGSIPQISIIKPVKQISTTANNTISISWKSPCTYINNVELVVQRTCNELFGSKHAVIENVYTCNQTCTEYIDHDIHFGNRYQYRIVTKRGAEQIKGVVTESIRIDEHRDAVYTYNNVILHLEAKELAYNTNVKDVRDLVPMIRCDRANMINAFDKSGKVKYNWPSMALMRSTPRACIKPQYTKSLPENYTLLIVIHKGKQPIALYQTCYENKKKTFKPFGYEKIKFDITNLLHVGGFSEMILYDRVLDSKQLDSLDLYMSTKYNTPLINI